MLKNSSQKALETGPNGVPILTQNLQKRRSEEHTRKKGCACWGLGTTYIKFDQNGSQHRRFLVYSWTYFLSRFMFIFCFLARQITVLPRRRRQQQQQQKRKTRQGNTREDPRPDKPKARPDRQNRTRRDKTRQNKTK